jgi:hypothetical protein
MVACKDIVKEERKREREAEMVEVLMDEILERGRVGEESCGMVWGGGDREADVVV